MFEKKIDKEDFAHIIYEHSNNIALTLDQVVEKICDEMKVLPKSFQVEKVREALRKYRQTRTKLEQTTVEIMEILEIKNQYYGLLKF